MLKIASYNVNSIRVRLDMLLQYLEEEQPDIIGLQETKVVDEEFPEEEICDAGYEVAFYGQKTHYGVALLSKQIPTNIQKGFLQDQEHAQRRIIIGTFLLPNKEELIVINGYFPQGESRDHPIKFPTKMKFYDDLLNTLKSYSPNQNIIVMGDFNIAPENIDIGIGEQNKKRWLQSGKCSFLPEEREKIEQLKQLGLYDTFRSLNPNIDNRFSWFDYRSKGFEREPKRGLRIDQIWVTKSLLHLCQKAEIDYKLRAMHRPSDHCVISAEFKI